MGYAGSHLERFNRGIYLHYIDLGKYNQMKRVSASEFHLKLDNVVDSKCTYEFNRENTYRLADTRIMYLSKGKQILGEHWQETGDEGLIESYWIDTTLIK